MLEGIPLKVQMYQCDTNWQLTETPAGIKHPNSIASNTLFAILVVISVITKVRVHFVLKKKMQSNIFSDKQEIVFNVNLFFEDNKINKLKHGREKNEDA